MIRSDKDTDTVEIRGYGSTVHYEFAQLVRVMITEGVATPEELKVSIDVANGTVKERKAGAVALSEEAAADLGSIIAKAVKEMVIEWAKPDGEKGTDNK